MRKSVILSFIMLVCLFPILVISGCSSSQKQEILKIGILHNEEALPDYVAEQAGYFKGKGLNVNFIIFPSAAERDAAIQAGAVDGVEGDMIAVALLKQGGTPVKAVALGLGATPAEGRFVLLAAPSGNLTLADLKGKKLAVSQNTIIEFMADQMLKNKGIDPSGVQKIYIPKMPLRLEMLLQNQVSCAVLPDPLASLAELKGAKVLIDDTKLNTNISQSVFYFREDALKNKSDAIKKFLAGYMKAGQDVTRTPDKYRTLFIEKVQLPVELQKTFPLPTFSALQLPGVDNVKMVLDWMRGKQILKQNYSYQDLVTDQFAK